MTEAEREKRIAEIRAELEDYLATPRSDWYKMFEAVLRVFTHKYGKLVQLVRINTEETIVNGPPGPDFLIVMEQKHLLADIAIFRIFRKYNICEYRNPQDALDERVILRACAYSYYFIGKRQ